MKKPKLATSSKFSREDVGFIVRSLSLASEPLRAAISEVTTEYDLGPRGAWILMLTARREVVYPLDLTHFLHAGRSLITAELNRLTESRLITYRKSSEDRRRVELALTPLGEKVSARVRENVTKAITSGFAAYSRDEVLLFARMLDEFVHAAPADGDQREAPVSTEAPRRQRASRDG